MPERLLVVKAEGCYLVAFDAAGEDWVACFEIEEAFPAREWAERMAFFYNAQNEIQDQLSAEEVAG